MKRMTLFIYVIIAACVLSTCASSTHTPKATKSDFLKTETGSFLVEINGGSLETSYYMTYGVIKDFEGDIKVIVEFENPNNLKEPVRFKKVISSSDKKLVAQSPVMDGFKHGKTYTVIVYGFDSTQALLFRHIQPIKYTKSPVLKELGF